MSFISVQKIRFDDVDGAGIVYYPHYFKLCHAAFEDFFDDAGTVSYPELISGRRLGFPTVAVVSQFHSPIKYGDVVIVDLSIERVGTSSADFGYLIRRRKDGQRCFEAKITTVLMSLDTHESVPIPDELRTLFRRYLRRAED